MSDANPLFIVIGLVALAVGGIAVVRPSLARGLLRLPDSEAAAYALRLGGVMLAAFGLAMLALTISAATAAVPSGAAR